MHESVLTGLRTGKMGRANLGLDAREDDVGGRAVEAMLQQLGVPAQLGKLGAVQLGRAAAAGGLRGRPGAEAGKGRKCGLQLLLADLDSGQLGHLQSAITVSYKFQSPTTCVVAGRSQLLLLTEVTLDLT